MAEEQFTSRRARREAERLAAEQAFEARETPEQQSEPSSDNYTGLPDEPAAPTQEPQAPEPGPVEPDSADSSSNLDPQQAPLPHFGSRTSRKNYLRDNGLSSKGDVSTGATPVIAGSEETSTEESDETSGEGTESVDAAGFGGSPDEVAARDFEAPVTAQSAPRPTALDDSPHDALSRPLEEPEGGSPPAPEAPGASAPVVPTGGDAESSDKPSAEALSDTPNDAPEAQSRSRRMPIVQPPSSSGVRVVTAASAQISEVDSPDDKVANDPSTGSTTDPKPSGETDPSTDSSAADSTAGGEDAEDETAASSVAAGASPDDAARALAANPETRPMETVPEAWALPNADYEDEETENPPGTRVRASAVTGHDGRILVGEEPSKVPFVVLGVAALFAVALIVIALVMLL